MIILSLGQLQICSMATIKNFNQSTIYIHILYRKFSNLKAHYYKTLMVV